MDRPVIFDYNDFKEYLKDAIKFKKTLDRKYTQRYIIDKLGASSTGYISDLLKGRINLSSTFTYRFSEILELDLKESEYFSNLVNYTQASTNEEKMVFYKRLIKEKEPESQIILQYQFDFYRMWYVSAIRELFLNSKVKVGNFQWIANNLVPPITLDEATYAVDLLLNCKLVVVKDGEYIATSQNIKKSTSFSGFYWKLYMESMLNLSMNALNFSKNLRDISALTLNLSKTEYDEIRQLLAEFRRKALQLSTLDKNDFKVYQINLQIFPLSQDIQNEE